MWKFFDILWYPSFIIERFQQLEYTLLKENDRNLYRLDLLLPSSLILGFGKLKKKKKYWTLGSRWISLEKFKEFSSDDKNSRKKKKKKKKAH